MYAVGYSKQSFYKQNKSLSGGILLYNWTYSGTCLYQFPFGPCVNLELVALDSV